MEDGSTGGQNGPFNPLYVVPGASQGNEMGLFGLFGLTGGILA
jgi:hypothetical protein